MCAEGADEGREAPARARDGCGVVGSDGCASAATGGVCARESSNLRKILGSQWFSLAATRGRKSSLARRHLHGTPRVTHDISSTQHMVRIGGACVRAPGSIEVEPPFQNAPPSAVQLPSRTKAARTIAAVALSSAGLSPEWIPQPSDSLRCTPTDCQGAGRGSAPSRGVTSDMGAPTRIYE